VLGCTHYPLLYEIIQEVIGEKVTLIDSGIAAAEVVRRAIERIGLQTNSHSIGNYDFYVSDLPNKFREVAELFFGKPVTNINKVDLDKLTSIKI
jgi:glutamate racemase